MLFTINRSPTTHAFENEFQHADNFLTAVKKERQDQHEN